MTNASLPETINAAEAAHFGALAAEWWDPKGSSAMLHKLNPVRLRFIRSALDAHLGGDGTSRRPLAGKNALDVGCGAGGAMGLLSARYPSAQVVGFDLSEGMLRQRDSGVRERLPRWLGGRTLCQ